MRRLSLILFTLIPVEFLMFLVVTIAGAKELTDLIGL